MKPDTLHASFDPLAIFWAVVGWTGFLALVISALLIAWMLLLPIVPWKQQRRDPFFDRDID
ncbi:energy-converting hydrogenase Eha subunit A [Labrenzia sp. EL_142]|nr:energy-converting hydrogenase Eha subunit A [Labrenzia sp. EL_142]